MTQTMRAKLIHPASAGKKDPQTPAEGQLRAAEKGGFAGVSVQNAGSDLIRNSDQESAKESAEYIAVLACQLQRIAESNGHEFLAYLIDMVVLEAWRIAGPEADHPETNADGAGGRRI